ncbi:hypothetical protein ECPA24_3958, partial [Escherichia coli PA24]
MLFSWQCYAPRK